MADDPVPHPRETFALLGHETAELNFADAIARGRLHHAWLLVGNEGLGKATFAYRAARRLLGAPTASSLGILGADPEHPVSRQILGRAHPDLMVLERFGDDGKPRKVIPVDDARRLAEFFSKSPAIAPHRVAIVDAADDLNNNAANAILKTLEEPPPKGILLMVSHAPGRLAATIRSRCRRLVFRPLEDAVTASFVQSRRDLNQLDALRLARMAQGAPGRALTLAASGALAMDDAARELLLQAPQFDETLALTLSDRFKGGDGMLQFSLLLERISEQVHELVLNRVGEGAHPLDRWAQAWETLKGMPREVEALNLDRVDAFYTALTELREAARA